MREDRAPEWDQTFHEELANSISHSVALVALLIGTPILILVAARRGPPSYVVGASVFCATAILVYLSSTLYHALPVRRGKRIFRTLDRTAIFVLIAGTYTPFTLGVLRGKLGWTLFGLVWGLAVLGVSLQLTGQMQRHPILSTSLYLAMGWISVVAIRPIMQTMPPGGIAWIAAGGLFYTFGIVFFAMKRLRYAHFVWHLFVIGGTTCHYFAVLWHAA
ncbi:MAG: hemolysin III family protein [Thermoanaerobaculia bacterium]|nr:hemolysin III family protein [Thermoanaerobaculia bacterium]